MRKSSWTTDSFPRPCHNLPNRLFLIPISFFFSFNANQHSPNNVRVANKCSSARDSFPSKIARAPVENSQSKSTCREDREKKRIPVLCFLLGTIFVCASPSKSMRFSLCVSACANASPTATVSARFRCCCLDATKCTSRTPKGKI